MSDMFCIFREMRINLLYIIRPTCLLPVLPYEQIHRPKTKDLPNPNTDVNLITYRKIITNKRRINYLDNEMFINKQQIAGILTSLPLVLLQLK